MNKSPRFRRESTLVLVGSIAAFLAAQSAHAASATWAVAPSSANWNASNWTGVSTSPASGDALIFGASSTTTINNDLTSGTAWIIPSITFSAGAPAYTISGNSFTLGGSSASTVITNSSTVTQTINDDFNLGNAAQTIVMTAGGGNVALTGNITGSGTNSGFVATGSGTLSLSGSNSYGGQTNIGANVTVRASNTSALGANRFRAIPNFNSGAAAVVVNNGGVLDLRYDSSATFGSGAGYNITTGSSTGSLANGTATINVDRDTAGSNNTITVGNLYMANGDKSVLLITGSNGYGLKAGTLGVNGGPSTFKNNTSVTLDAVSFIGGGGGVGIIFDGTGTTTVNGNLVRSSFNLAAQQLQKIGTGTVNLNGAVNYWGASTTVSEGTLNIKGAIGDSNGLLTVQNLNTGAGTDVALNLYSSWNINGLAGLVSGASTGTNTATINLNGADVTLTDRQTGGVSNTFQGTIAGTGGFTITSRTRNIPNSVEQVLTLFGKNTYSGATTLNGGTLKLDFTQTGAPITNILNNTANNSTLVMGGGALILQGKASNTNSQQFNGLDVKAGASSITLNANATANPLLLSLGAITRNTGGGTVNFVNPTTALSVSNGITTTTANTNGILGGYATVGNSSWATNNGIGIVALGESAYATDTWTSGTNTTVTTSSAPASGAVTNSLRFNAAGANTVTLGGINTITSGGLLVTSTVGANASTISGGTLRGASGQDLVVIQNNTLGALTIGSVIADNTTATGFTKSGAGTVTLTGANTYTGATSINGGVVQISAANGLGDATATTNTISLNGGGTLDSTAGTYDLGANRNIALNGSGSIQVDSGALTVSSVISGAGMLSKSGLGTLILTGMNTFTSEMTVSAGILNIQNSKALGSDSLGATLNQSTTIPTTVSNGATLQIQGGIALGSETILISGNGASGQNGALVNVSGYNTIGRYDSLGAANSTIGLATAASTISVDAGSLNLIGQYGIGGTGASNSGTFALTLTGAGNGSTGSTSSMSSITSLTKNGTGMWTFNNNYSFIGPVTLNAGVLNINALANAGTNSGLGKSSVAASNVIFGGGTLRVMNTSSTDRGFTINDGVTAGFEVAPSVTATISGSAVNAANAMSTGGLTKTGAGTLVLSGSLAYSGTTTINGGTLKLDFAGVNAPATNMVSGAGALAMGGGTLNMSGKANTSNSQTFNGLTLNLGASTIALTGAATNPITANLGAITHNTGGTLNFSVTPLASGTTATTSNSNNATGILGTWVTTGTGTALSYATQTGVSNQIGAYSTGTQANGTGLTDTAGTANYNLGAGGGTVQATVSANTIRYVGTTAATTTLGATAFSVNGLMNAGSNSWTINSNALTIGDNKELVIQTNNQAINIGSSIQDNAGGASSLAFTSIGGGALTLSGSNGYTGPTYINSGMLKINSANNLGNSQIFLSGTLYSTGNTYDLGTTRAITLNGPSGGIQSDTGTLTVSGSITNAGNLLTVSGNGNTTISGVIGSGNGGLTKVNGGTLTLTNANTYRGDTMVNGGVLNIRNSNALGTTEGATIVGNGGSLQLQGGINVAEEGLSILGGGSLVNVSENNTYSGPISLAPMTNMFVGTSTISANAGTLLTVAGNISTGYNLLVVTGAGDTTVTGGISTGAIGIQKNGTGTLVLAGNNSFTGQTVVSGGVVGITSDAALGAAYDGSIGGYFTTGTGTGYNTGVNIITVDAPTTPGGTTAVVGQLNTNTGQSSIGNLSLSGNEGSGYIYDPTVTIVNTGVGTSGTVAAVVKGLLTLDGGTLRTDANISSNRAVVITANNGTIDTNGHNSTFSGIFNNGAGGNGSLTKTGLGTLALTGNNIYTGATFVNAGKLAVNGSIGTGLVTVNSGGILGGSGTVGGAVSVQSGGHFAPGNSITTTFNTGALTLEAGSLSDFELGTASATRGAADISLTNDRTTVNGALALDGTLNLIDNANTGGLGSVGAGSYKIFNQTGLASGTFSSVSNIEGYHAKVDYSVSGGVYIDNYQIAKVNTLSTTVNLGITHVGEGFTNSALTIQNTGTSATYTEGLNATKGATTSDATVNGTDISNLAAGSTSTAISVGLTDASAGAKSGTVTIGFASNGSISGYADQDLGSQTVTVSGQVNEYAAPTITDGGAGLLSGEGTSYTLNLGSFALGNDTYNTTLTLNNILKASSSTYQDLLGGSFTLISGDGISLNLENFSGVVAGNSQNLTVSFDSTGIEAGSYTGLFRFNSTSTNDGGTYTGDIIDVNLAFQVVPEPATWSMIVGGIGMMAFVQRIRRRMS